MGKLVIYKAVSVEMDAFLLMKFLAVLLELEGTGEERKLAETKNMEVVFSHTTRLLKHWQ